MTREPSAFLRSVAVAGVLVSVGLACRLRPPDVPMPRMIEPQLVDPPSPPPSSATTSGEIREAIAIRLLETQARAHIGRRLLHHEPGGELVEDAVWRWTSAPDRYLDSALRLAISATPRLKYVDAGSAVAVGVTLLEWQMESTGTRRLAGAVELQVTRPDRAVRTQVVRGTEPVSAELPGDLGAAAGRLMQRLATECLVRVLEALKGSEEIGPGVISS